MAKTKARKSAKTAKAQRTYQLWVRTDDGVQPVGGPTKAPAWRANAMVGFLLERPDVQTAWAAKVAA
jgi:hypothetical protein